MSRADEFDIGRIQQWIAFCSMPGEDNPTLEAIARQFPRMLAALRFVEEHGEAVREALTVAIAYDKGVGDSGLMKATEDAQEAIRRLTAERGTDG